jgi:hypothetical protein
MTNRDRFNSMSNDELGHFFCQAMEIIGDNTENGLCCSICPVEHLCKKGKNGFITWLENEESKT